MRTLVPKSNPNGKDHKYDHPSVQTPLLPSMTPQGDSSDDDEERVDAKLTNFDDVETNDIETPYIPLQNSLTASPEEIQQHERSYSSKTYHPETKARSFERRRTAALEAKIKEPLNALKLNLEQKNDADYSFASKLINWNDALEEHLEHNISKGMWWFWPEWQDIICPPGRYLLTGSQWLEVGFALAGAVLSAEGLKDPDAPPLFSNPAFYATVITTALIPLTLFMNWHGVDPNEFEEEVVRPKKLRYDVAQYRASEGKEIVFREAIIDEEDLGFRNDFDLQFFIHALAPYTKKEPYSFYQSLNALHSYAIQATFLANNLLGPPANWAFIGWLMSLSSNISLTTKLSIGLLTLLPVEIMGFCYYLSMLRDPVRNATIKFFSSMNDVFCAFKIAPAAAALSFLEYGLNDILRGFSISAANHKVLEDLGVPEAMGTVAWEDFSFALDTLTVATIAYFTAVRSFRSFNPITQPMRFSTPVATTQQLTDESILNFRGIRKFVGTQVSRKDIAKIVFYAIVYSLGWTGPAYFVGLSHTSSGHITAAFLGLAIMALRIYTQQGRLTAHRAATIIKYLRGYASKEMNPGAKSLNTITVASDAFARVSSRSGSIQKITFIRNLGMDPTLLWVSATLGAGPTVRPEYDFFLATMSKNVASTVKEVQQIASGEKKLDGCCARPKKTCAKILVKYLSCWFGKADPVAHPDGTQLQPTALNPRQQDFLNGKHLSGGGLMDGITRSNRKQREEIIKKEMLVREEIQPTCIIL